VSFLTNTRGFDELKRRFINFGEDI